MALLLNIDTATEVASVCVSKDGLCVAFKKTQHQREHASFVHAAVSEVLLEANVQLKEIEGFAITSGPGSYTGLRVGMATAKGFCFAHNKPLIAINTLKVMAKAALKTISGKGNINLICPMIDARRMEVFTALYNLKLKTILKPQPLILEEKSFDEELKNGKVLFLGSGATKFKAIKAGENMIFKNIDYSAQDLAALAEEAFLQECFADTSYSQPEYFKDFHSLTTNNVS